MAKNPAPKKTPAQATPGDKKKEIVSYELKAMEEAKTKPREAVVDRSKELQQETPLVKNLRSVLHRQLDRLLLNFKKTHPEFYAGYLAARVLVDRGHSAKKKTPPSPPPPTTPAP